MPELRIEYLAPISLKPNPRNAPLHLGKQIRQIADSIRKFGFTNRLLIDEHRTILAGHGRFEAAKHLNLERLPCVRLDHMSAEQKRAYALADNKLALNAGWDEEILAQELQALLEIDFDFDIGLTGFSIAEIDCLVEGLNPEEPGDPEDDRLPALDKSDVISRPGDLRGVFRPGVIAIPWLGCVCRLTCSHASMRWR
jgi:ParB-like chromosome segregation protein Spo0J